MHAVFASLAAAALLAASPTAASEKAAVLALVPDAQVTVRAVANGEWDNPATWSTGAVPGDDAHVLIPAGQIVLVDHLDDARLHTLRVDGDLEFAQTGESRLLVETIVVNEGGVLDVGTKTAPVSGSATIVFLDRGPIVNQSSRGLLSLGMVALHGEPRPYTKGVVKVGAGYAPADDLTRCVTLRSENPAAGRRGHVMLMHHGDYSIGWTAFLDLGRTSKAQPISATNVRGRYPLHFHRAANLAGAPIEVVGIVVKGSLGWGPTNHSSHVVIRDSICVDCFGAGFVGEAGNEKGAFLNCLAINSKGSGDKGGSLQIINEARKKIGDYGHLGDGFWLQGPGIALIENLAVGNAFAGYDVYNNGFKEPDTGAIAFPFSRNTPLAEQRGNVAIGSPFGRLDQYSAVEGSIVVDHTSTDCDVGSHQISALVEYRSPLYERCRIGHDGGTDYGGPTRQFNVTAKGCELAINVGSTRWLSGHSIVDGLTGEGNTLDLLVRQADPGLTEIKNVNGASMQWKHITGGSIDVRMRLFYGESQRVFELDGRRAFFPVQHPTAKPWGSGPYAGQTNAQIFAETGKLPLGALIPDDATNQGEYWLAP